MGGWRIIKTKSLGFNKTGLESDNQISKNYSLKLLILGSTWNSNGESEYFQVKPNALSPHTFSDPENNETSDGRP